MIDAHIHYGDDDPALLALLDELDLMLLNICVADDAHGAWRTQADTYRDLADRYPARFAWCTSFDLPRLDDLDYANHVIHQLDADFDAGAVACKVWKNIGMEARTLAGDFMMVDDPLFAPIFKHIAARGRALLMHIAEPLACWQPLDPRSPHYGYYSNNPEWHMHGKDGFPAHGELIAARDRMIERNPNLRVVGAHLGSLEHDVDEVAARLDAYMNFAVDVSARVADLAVQDSSKVRAFMVKYQDQVLFGTDVVMRARPSTLPAAERDAAIAALRATYGMHFAYFANRGPVTVRGYETEGLALPPAVLDKFRRTNALRWYAGI